MSLSTKSTYNLKVVVKKTGIAADTLRAWERRYGLPIPERTPGGHRLYSQRDIEIIKWLMEKQKEGLSISRAVDLWNELSASGQSPLPAPVSQNISHVPATSLEAARKAWLDACLAFNETEAEHILNQAFAANSVELVCTEVVQRGLFEIGELWYQNKASVQQEHFASGLAMRRMEVLLSASPPPTRAETILTACPPDELHVFPMLMLTLFLRRRGWNVIHLGANVPIERMREAILSILPALVVLSAQQLITAVSLRNMARFLRENNVQTGFGGRAFNHISGLNEHIPAHYLGATIEMSLQKIETLSINPVPAPVGSPTSETDRAVIADFAQKRPLIEATLSEELQAKGIDLTHFNTATHFIGNTISAALEMGNLQYLNADMDWLRNLLTPRGIPTSVLPTYLQIYEQAITRTMGSSGKAITLWLNLFHQQISQSL
ncbi:MAG: hypothetical protein Kow002_19880 [Anaerolineales bacterium]